MRIVAGTHGGRVIRPPGNLPVRPTTDRAKESLFNILATRYDFGEIAALDLFAGTGNISFELASRGCPDVLSLDKNKNCVNFIKSESARLGFENIIKVVQADVFPYLSKLSGRFDLIFADPPYKLEKLENLVNKIFQLNLLAEKGRFILEHSIKSEINAGIKPVDQRKYGQSMFSIFKHQEL